MLDVAQAVGAILGLEPMLEHMELEAVSLVVALEGEAVAAELPHSQLEVVLAIHELAEGIDWGRQVGPGAAGVGDCCDESAVVVRAIKEGCKLLPEGVAQTLEGVDVRGRDEVVEAVGPILLRLLELD